MSLNFAQRYETELLTKTMRFGPIVAWIAIVFTIYFYYGDVSILQLENTLPWRLLGVSGAVIYLLFHYTKLAIPSLGGLYGMMLVAIIGMMAGIQYIIFCSMSSATEQQTMGITLGTITVWVAVALVGINGRKIIMIGGGSILLLITMISYYYKSSESYTGMIATLLMLGILSIWLIYTRGKTDRESAFSMYQLEEQKNQIEQQASDLQEMNENLVTFNRAMSHDLQSPLRRVRSFLDLYEHRAKGRLPEDVQEYLDLARTYLDQGQRVVTDLLTYAKIGNDELEVEPLPLLSICDNIIKEQCTGELETNQPEIIYDFQIAAITADQTLFWHLLTNLLSNAFKFSRDQSPPVIQIRSWADGQHHYLQVKDNGIGFDEQFKEQLGQPFKRLHSTQYTGTGMGLSIVKQVMRLHNGNMTAESPDEGGATFTCAFPIQ